MKYYSVGGKLVSRNVHRLKIIWSADSRSKFQTKIKNLLLPIWRNDIVFEEFPVFGTRLTLDFLNASRNIAVEVQGIQHIKYTPFFQNGESAYLDQLKRDQKKLVFCENNKIRLVEIFPEDMTAIESGRITLKSIIDGKS